MTSEEKMRVQFEQEASVWSSNYNDRDETGAYRDRSVNGAWITWQIAWQAAIHSVEAEKPKPVGHFYNRPSEGRVGVEWCCDHLDDGAALYAEPVGVEAEKESQWKASGYQYPVAMSHNPDAKAWADFFMATFPNCGADPGIMLGWFANAMMAMHDHIVSEAEKEPEWLDIDSAPKDRHILGCQSRHGIMRVVRGPIDEFGNWSTGPSSMDFLAEVTHWMELPAPPEHKPE